MPRGRSYNTDELLRILDEYRFDNAGKKISIPKFGEYIRSLGYEIEDYTLRRDEGFRKAIQEINNENDSVVYNNLVAYKSLDIDAFINKNNTKSKLKEALSLRDKYYAKVAIYAMDSIKAKKGLEQKIDELENEIKELKSEISKLQALLDKKKVDNSELKEKNEVILKLREILETYIYPDMANALLETEGILDAVNQLVDFETVTKKLITADSVIDADESEGLTEFNSINSLLGGFNE